jgi:hypothetical protein
MLAEARDQIVRLGKDGPVLNMNMVHCRPSRLSFSQGRLLASSYFQMPHSRGERRVHQKGWRGPPAAAIGRP